MPPRENSVRGQRGQFVADGCLMTHASFQSWQNVLERGEGGAGKTDTERQRQAGTRSSLCAPEEVGIAVKSEGETRAKEGGERRLQGKPESLLSWIKNDQGRVEANTATKCIIPGDIEDTPVRHFLALNMIKMIQFYEYHSYIYNQSDHIYLSRHFVISWGVLFMLCSRKMTLLDDTFSILTFEKYDFSLITLLIIDKKSTPNRLS